MYCIFCGVKLADTEKKCPICGTAVYHPELPLKDAEPLYPQQQYPVEQVSPKGAAVILTTLFLIPFLITLLYDLHVSGTVTWSGYVMGALGLGYVVFILPVWFRKPNPVIFVPCDFLALGLYLLYIDLYTGGGWFLSFAFPVTGILGALFTTLTVLLRYLRRGRLYIYGGVLMAAGGFMPLIEFLLTLTFPIPVIGWSIYPAVSLILLGGLLIFLAINRHCRESLRKKHLSKPWGTGIRGGCRFPIFTNKVRAFQGNSAIFTNFNVLGYYFCISYKKLFFLQFSD